MPNPYDLALRERAVTAYERGDGSSAQLAALFDVDHRTLERWVARWRDTQSLAPQAACTAGNYAYCTYRGVLTTP
jgi:transposase-like protein